MQRCVFDSSPLCRPPSLSRWGACHCWWSSRWLHLRIAVLVEWTRKLRPHCLNQAWAVEPSRAIFQGCALLAKRKWSQPSGGRVWQRGFSKSGVSFLPQPFDAQFLKCGIRSHAGHKEAGRRSQSLSERLPASLQGSTSQPLTQGTRYGSESDLWA